MKAPDDETEKMERELYQAALEVEQDEEMSSEMRDWDAMVGDGIKPSEKLEF